MPRIITIKEDLTRPEDRETLEKAAQILEQGGVIAFPTETFYGLAADSENEDAVKRLNFIKNRPKGKPFPLIAGSTDQARDLSYDLSPLVLRLMEEYWPGPLTLILTAGKPGPAVSEQGGVGVRVSPHAVARGLALALGRPITATSANLSGRPSVKSVADLDPELVERLDLILDGGETPGGLASTVARVDNDQIVILRPGPVDPSSA
ncbi:L-threonylcarbamoyladenylate synthase [Dethiosulfatarculus sandiegensis]|uniref:L-threonylcarbamoyladenylate synthase n=1 Tax=Dethiosulfatarculus sandiegensis TaxID=1429043 RepID=UPI00069747F5|nr:L-threonylcarbamoyladenylate synthase [Dethiosulfatarculus sandiegensis]